MSDDAEVIQNRVVLGEYSRAYWLGKTLTEKYVGGLFGWLN
jgi:hypothetical protein